MRPMPLVLFSSVALVAQAPAPLDLAKRFNEQLPQVNLLLKEFKTQEALTKVQALLPPQRPGFDISSPKAMGQSLDNAAGLMSIHRLHANVLSEAGLWEKAVEVQETRAADARSILADLQRAQAPLAAQWKKVVQDATDYAAKNEPRKAELEPKIAAFKAEYEKIKAGEKKLSKKEADEFNAQASKIQQEEQELAQITESLRVHKQNAAMAPRVTKMLGDNQKEVENLVKAADEALVKAKQAVAAQNEEITKFNTEQILKKVKLVGKKNWVDAVLRNRENLTKQGTPQAQAAFLNRMLVLDPGNAGAQKALDNLKAGKEAFAKEAKPTKKGARKS